MFDSVLFTKLGKFTLELGSPVSVYNTGPTQSVEPSRDNSYD